MNCYKCNQIIPEYSLVCPRCGAEMSQRARTGYSFRDMNMPPVMPLGMAWFSFLMFFYLFFEGVSSAISGLSLIFNFLPPVKIYGEELITCYANINMRFRVVDVVYGILSVGFAAMAFFTRFRLSARKKDAPLLLILYFSVPTVINLIYSIGLFVLANEPAVSFVSLVFQAGVQTAFVYANYTYFKKRKHLFNK